MQELLALPDADFERKLQLVGSMNFPGADQQVAIFREARRRAATRAATSAPTIIAP